MATLFSEKIDILKHLNHIVFVELLKRKVNFFPLFVYCEKNTYQQNENQDCAEPELKAPIGFCFCSHDVEDP